MVSSILAGGVSVGEGLARAGVRVGFSGVLDGRTMGVGRRLVLDGVSNEVSGVRTGWQAHKMRRIARNLTCLMILIFI
jgi:hypothetical protein